MTTNWTSLSASGERMRLGSRRLGDVTDLPENRFAFECVLDSTLRSQLEQPFDVRDVGVVVVGQLVRQLESAGSNQPAQRLEARFDPTSFPASDLRLGAADALTKLFLRQSRTKPRFT